MILQSCYTPAFVEQAVFQELPPKIILDIGVEENVTPSPSESAGPSLLYSEDQKHPGLAGFVGFGL